MGSNISKMTVTMNLDEEAFYERILNSVTNTLLDYIDIGGVSISKLDELTHGIANKHDCLINFNYERFTVFLRGEDIADEADVKYTAINKLQRVLDSTFRKIFSQELEAYDDDNEASDISTSDESYMYLGRFNDKSYVLHLTLHRIDDRIE